MLKEKTQGNISINVKKIHNEILSELHLNYVDEKNKTLKKVEEKKKEKKTKEINKKRNN